jgi:hypothetical protein
MADIDFITDMTEGFQISLTDNPRKVSGNRALLNRFEITFLTERRVFYTDTDKVQDNFGGNANSLIGKPQVLNNLDAIAASITLVMKETVRCMQLDEPNGLPDTEKIEKAELIGIDVIDDIVTAQIRVYPVEAETYSALEFNLPIIKRS